MRAEGEIRFPEGWARTSHPGCELDVLRQQLITWIREVRGAVLTGAYEVERNLGGFIEFYFLGGRAANQSIRSIFEEEVLRPLTFERHINLATRVAQELLPQAERRRLQGRLNDLKTLRNAMAHNPCWFEPYLDHKAKLVQLRAKIMKGKQELTLDNSWCEKMSEDMVALIEDTGRLVYLTLDPARAEVD